MEFFSDDFNRFFIELAANNRKEWFDVRRERYQANVNRPFVHFVDTLIVELRAFGLSADIQPSDLIYRINRDVRFSKDKSPYKLNRSALIGNYGKKEMGFPALYIELGPEHVYLAGGSYMPSREQLESIRDSIVNQSVEWKKAVSAKDFVSHWGKVKGDVQKRLSNATHKDAAETLPVIFQKQFYYEARLPADSILNGDFLETIVQHYKAAQPVHRFIEAALLRG